MEVFLDPIPVIYIGTTAPGPQVQKAFDTLESKLSTRDREFYGVFFHRTGEYRACVRIEHGEKPETLGLAGWTIPGGKYKSQGLHDWQTKISRFPEIFAEMAKGEKVDSTRPSVEYYRSMTECVLYLPLKN